MKKTLLLFLISISTFNLFSQTTKNVWSEVQEIKIKISGKREIVPEKYKTYNLDIESLKIQLQNIQNDKSVSINNSNAIISIPIPNGQIQQFKVIESSTMDDDLQNRFPNIRTYSVKGIDDIYANGKIDINEFGFHAMIKSVNGDFFIDPYSQKNISDYIVYYTSDFKKKLEESQKCLNNEIESSLKLASPNVLICAGANLRSYRLAVSCTGEYAIAATGLPTPNVAQTLAKVVTTINRVNGVYETEFAVRLVLINATTTVLYTVPNVGFTSAQNLSGGALLNANYTVLDTNIGQPNFDIGHAFSTGAGGVAFVGCVCGGSKSAGVTGRSQPYGDPYDIDYVCHEMGHQLGGEHSFNSITSSCSVRNAPTSMEPGSGITVMGYAGICGADNLASNSIPYFHAVSYDQIMTKTTASSCKTTTSTGNNEPSVTSSIDFTIPKNTPFTLTGSATDPNGDALTYQWEEMDAGASGSTWNAGTKPFFRSYSPVISPSRMFPNLSVVLSGNYQATKGEYLPTNSQILKFRLTARDNKMGGGGVCSANTTITVDNSGPFDVTSQNSTGIIYNSNSIQTITWNVNGTNNTPVNCANVNILISTDGGNTFTTLLANTPNDGTENAQMPILSSTSSTCRIKVESVGNVFFDLNNSDFTISNVLGVNNNLYSIGVQVYPNPFSSTITIDFSNNTNFDILNTKINIFNLLGQSVRTENIKSTKTYDLSDLSNGAYVIEITDGKQKGFTRMIKI